MNMNTLPNTSIDFAEIAGHTVGLYQIWPTFGGGFIVTSRNGSEISRVQYENERDARRDFAGWVDAFTREADARDAAETTAGLHRF